MVKLEYGDDLVHRRLVVLIIAINPCQVEVGINPLELSNYYPVNSLHPLNYMVFRPASLTSWCSLLEVNMFETLAYRGIGEESRL